MLAAAVLVAYFKVFSAGFIAWDDMEYTVHNPDIAAISIDNIKAWFSGFYLGNYHPFTLFSYALDYLIGGQQPLAYHVTNVLIHVCNAVMLYFFLNKLQPYKAIGFLAALLFAVHPMQTESVSWIAERKTLLCAFFYFLALLQYIRYLSIPSVKNLVLVCLAGVAAMLSKGVAVALPLSLFAVDIWMQRDLRDRKVWTEKIPLFIVAVILGVVAIKAQQAGKFTGLHPEYNWYDTILFAATGYMQYIFRFFVPVQLSVVYPYPKESGYLQNLSLLVAAGVLALAFIAYRKKWFILCGGIVFYTVNIVFLLQFVQFGEVLTADRYAYIAGVGILFPAVYYLFAWLSKRLKAVLATAVWGSVALVLLVMTFMRNDIWQSDFNFFSAILDTFPGSAVAQYSVGGLYMRKGDYAEAEKHINLAVELDPHNYKAWYNKGVLYLRERKPAEAMDALNRCIEIKEYPKAYFSRAVLYQGAGAPDKALSDIEKVLDDQPRNSRAYYIAADCLEQQGKDGEAMENYTKAIQFESKEPLFYIRRGLLLAKAKQNEAALKDLNTAVELNPDNGEALYFRGIVNFRNGHDPCGDFRNALNHGYKQAQEAIDKACKH